MHALIRPSIAALFIVALTACGGGGGGDTPENGTPGTPAATKVWVGDRLNAAIGSSPNSNPPAGALVVNRVIAGGNTQLTTSLFDFALDQANDRLYVADLRNILVFFNASTANGNVVPRTVTTIPGSFGGFSGGIHLDTANNRLYAGTNFVSATQTVQVFDQVSSAIFAAPDRSITFASSAIRDIVVDVGRNILYVYSSDANGFTQILAFNNASTRFGTVVPDRIIAINDSGGSGPIGMFLDAANDRLYVPRNNGTISVLDLVSTIPTGLAAPTRTIFLSVPTYHVVFVELSANRLYALDANGIDIIPNASSVTLPPPFARALVPPGSQFQAIVVRP